MPTKTAATPGADDKVGLKIDYLARRLGALLAPHGVKRQGRLLKAQAGSGAQQHWRLVQLQAGEYNEGPQGKFYVNLALQFPAIERQLAARPGQAWRLDRIDQPDIAGGHLSERLEALLCGEPPHPLAGSEITIRRDTDLAVLADQLEAALRDVGWPWLEAHARLEAVRDFSGSLLVADIPVRIAAALALDDKAGAQALVARHRGRWENFHAAALKDLRQWLQAAGLDITEVPATPPQRSPSAWEHRQAAAAEAEQRERQAEADAARGRLLATPRAAAAVPAEAASITAPAALAEAWRTAWRARPGSDGASPLQDLPLGRQVAALDEAGREAVLCALLDRLVAHEAGARRDPIHADARDFELDASIRPLLQALLPGLAVLSPAGTQAVLTAMAALIGRQQQELITAHFPWGFALLAQWLPKAGRASHAMLAAGIEAWLQALSRQAVADYDARGAALAAANAKPLDPAHPLYESLAAARETAAAAPPVDHAAVRRRLAEYPEQSLAAEDKAAVAQWRQWLRRDPVTGLLPVSLDGDDWGAAFNAAWAQAAPALRAAAQPLLQQWLEGTEPRPGARWLRALGQTVAAFDPAGAPAWRDWLLQRLHAFAHSSGHTEWATTGARPGVGARLGAGSQSVLLALLWWTALDAAIDEARCIAAWQAVADAAWTRLPEVGARAPAVGTLALRLLAGCEGEARARVAALAQAKGARQLAQAAAKALADPFRR